MKKIDAKSLKQAINEIESLEQQKKRITQDIQAAYNTAKDSDLNVKIIKQLIKTRHMKRETIHEEMQLLNDYLELID